MSSDPQPTPASPRQQKRLSRPALFMQVAVLFGQRSSCPRADVGAVAVLDRRIIATGYVGAPSGLPHCDVVGCDIGPEGGCVRTIHAEANLITWAARTGTSLSGAVMYCTHAPCRNCAQLIANAGFKALVYGKLYRDPRGLQLLRLLDIYSYDITKTSHGLDQVLHES